MYLNILHFKKEGIKTINFDAKDENIVPIDCKLKKNNCTYLP